MPSIFSADWRNEVNGELAAKQPLNATLSQITNSGTLNLFGGQIAFPANRIPSANPNTLDDYEEGTWTPTISFGGASVGVAYGARTATYTKIGRLVQAQFDMIISAKGTSAGNAELGGWPFVSLHPYAAGIAPHYSGMTDIVGGINFIMGASLAALRHNNNPTTVANLTHANFNNGARLIGTMTYPTT